MTWRAGGTRPTGDHPNGEPNVVELAGGDLLVNARVEGRPYRVTARSADAGVTWTESRRGPAIPEHFPTHAGMLRLPDAAPGAARLLFSFPDASERRNMSIWLSDDRGQTWPVRRVVNPGPSYYSNLAALPDGSVALIYGRDGAHRSMPARTVLARFTPDWLTAAPDAPSPPSLPPAR